MDRPSSHNGTPTATRMSMTTGEVKGNQLNQSKATMSGFSIA